MDLSIWAFEKLASKSNGVIGVSFRQVPCDYHPSKEAAKLSNPSPPELPPSGAKRPAEKIFVKRFDGAGQDQGAVSTIDSTSQANGKPIVPVSQLYQDGSLTSTSTPPSSTGGSGCSDKQPTDGSTCQKQKEWGKCEEGWIKSGGYCQNTCGHCKVQSFEGRR